MQKFTLRAIFHLALLLDVLSPGTAYALDAAAFNPVPVSVQASVIGGGVPVGAIVAWPVALNPADIQFWLECNGQSTTGYPELAAVIGANVPDLRGRFLRGLGGNSAGLGVAQGDAIRNITGRTGPMHCTEFNSDYYPNGDKGSGALRQVAGMVEGSNADNAGHDSISITLDASMQVPTANENRPVNMAVRYLIRARP